MTFTRALNTPQAGKWQDEIWATNQWGKVHKITKTNDFWQTGHVALWDWAKNGWDRVQKDQKPGVA